MTKKMKLVSFALAIALTTAACGGATDDLTEAADGAADAAGDAADGAADAAGDAADGAADAAGDAADGAADAAGDAAEGAADAAGDAADAAGDAVTDDEAMEDDAADETAEDATGDDEGAEVGTIVDVASEAGSFSTLLAAAEAAGLVETLNGDGPLTVFAPTDDAFTATLGELGLTADELLADTEQLTAILTYHVVNGQVLSTDLADGPVPTVNGAEINIDLSAGVKVNEANVVAPDIQASNGIIHVIDAVLVP